MVTYGHRVGSKSGHLSGPLGKIQSQRNRMTISEESTTNVSLTMWKISLLLVHGKRASAAAIQSKFRM